MLYSCSFFISVLVYNRALSRAENERTNKRTSDPSNEGVLLQIQALTISDRVRPLPLELVPTSWRSIDAARLGNNPLGAFSSNGAFRLGGKSRTPTRHAMVGGRTALGVHTAADMDDSVEGDDGDMEGGDGSR